MNIIEYVKNIFTPKSSVDGDGWTGSVRFIHGRLVTITEETPPYDPTEGQTPTYWELWNKEGKFFTVCFRTPNAGGEVHKIQLDLKYRSQIYTMPIPKYRRVLDSDEPTGYRLITNWETTADRDNLQRDYAWLPEQDVLRSGLQTRILPTFWEEARHLGAPWDGCYVLRSSLRELGSPDPVTEPPITSPPEHPPYVHYTDAMAAPPPDPDYVTPSNFKLWIPDPIVVPDDENSWVKINYDENVRYSGLTVPHTIPLLIPGQNQNPWVEKELWMPFSEEWQWVVWRWTQLASPQRSHNYHVWAYRKLFEDHKFATDLNDYEGHTNYVLSHFIDPEKYNLALHKPFKVKISLALAGNPLCGYWNGSQFIARSWDIHNPPTNPDAAYHEFHRSHKATQSGKKLEDGTIKTPNFPMGRNRLKADGTWEKTGTKWPVIGVGNWVGISKSRVTEYMAGNSFYVENLERMQA